MIDSARGTDAFKRAPQYFIRSRTDDEVILVCRVYEYNGLEKADTPPLEYEYKFVRNGQNWLCSEFPVIW